MLYQEPLSFWDSLISNIPPHALFNRLSFFVACLLAGIISMILGARWIESKTHYEVLSNNFPNGALFLFDHQFVVRVAGGKALEQMGISNKEIKRKTLAEVFPSIWDSMRSHCEEALDGRENVFTLDHANRSYNFTAIPVLGIQTSKRQGIFNNSGYHNTHTGRNRKRKTAGPASAGPEDGSHRHACRWNISRF